MFKLRLDICGNLKIFEGIMTAQPLLVVVDLHCLLLISQ